RFTSPMRTIRYPTTMVVNTSKNASTHIWMTHHLQKSAMTKLVSGVAIKPEMSKMRIDTTAYNNQFGRAHGLRVFNTGFTPRYTITAHRANIPSSIYWYNRPSSTNSHPW